MTKATDKVFGLAKAVDETVRRVDAQQAVIDGILHERARVIAALREALPAWVGEEAARRGIDLNSSAFTEAYEVAIGLLDDSRKRLSPRESVVTAMSRIENRLETLEEELTHDD